MKKYAVIVAGGSGMRMGTPVPKQFLELMGRPVLWYTLNAFLESFQDLEIVLVLPEKHFDTGTSVVQQVRQPERIVMVSGGETRFHSVQKGLDRIQQHSIVFIHDGVRCMVTPALIRRCYEKAREFGNAIPAVAAVDTIRMQTVMGNEQVDRNKIRIIQTPQTFYSDILKAAYEQEYEDSFTDEATVVERLGVKIHLVEGESSNIKITRPIDVILAERILEERSMGL